MAMFSRSLRNDRGGLAGWRSRLVIGFDRETAGSNVGNEMVVRLEVQEATQRKYGYGASIEPAVKKSMDRIIPIGIRDRGYRPVCGYFDYHINSNVNRRIARVSIYLVFA